MPKEIERKFLVKYNNLEKYLELSGGIGINQGYISEYPNPTVRIRMLGPHFSAKLTIKGETDGITRDEYEYDIPISDAKEMLQMCPKILSKTRYIFGRFEIDVFHGNLEGLVIAEIELESEDEEFEVPSWFGPEVSHDSRFYNSNLINYRFEEISNAE